MSAATASVGALRSELARVEDQEAALRKELQKAQREVLEARQAGAALLTAVEAAMAPLMQELASARNACSTKDLTDALGGAGGTDANLGALRSSSAAGLEAEIRHLELDISQCQEQVESLHTEERQHDHEHRRLQHDITEVHESLSYEKQRARHYEMKKHLVPGGTVGWAGLGPSGIGRRTMEVRSEQQLRESAEKVAHKFSRDLGKLAMETSSQQATIEQLNRRLGNVRKNAEHRDVHLKVALTSTSELHRRLKGEGPEPGSEVHKKKNKGAASTGKLPHLSF